MISHSNEATLTERRAAAAKSPSMRWPSLILATLVVLLIFGIIRHVRAKSEQKDFAQRTSELSAEFATVRRDTKPRELQLPGNIVAAQETTIYARSSGYVKRWLVDIGADVQAGQLLVEITTPEVEQQLAQARGELDQSSANFELARVSAQRWKELAARKVVALQENDERQSAFQAASASLAASKANVARLEQTIGFNQVTAPFAGKITSRKIDVGALVSQGSGTAGTALFTLAQTDPVRIFVSVPQTQAPLFSEGLDAKVFVPEYPGRDFTGKVTRTSGALDPQSRTLLVEVQIPNPEGALLPGMYAQVKFTLQNKNVPLTIPAAAFVFREEGTQVAVLNAENQVHWQTIEVGRDFGTSLEVLSGIEENARVIVNPNDDLREGLRVQAKSSGTKAGSAGK